MRRTRVRVIEGYESEIVNSNLRSDREAARRIFGARIYLTACHINRVSKISFALRVRAYVLRILIFFRPFILRLSPSPPSPSGDENRSRRVPK